MTKYEVKAYAKENGNYEMIEWATGISATSVQHYYNRLQNPNEKFSMINVIRTEEKSFAANAIAVKTEVYVRNF